MSLDRPSLAAIQRQFYALVTAPEGVGQALAEAGRGPRDLETMVVSDGKLDAVSRLDVYANMYFYRILEVLREAYPKVTAVVGDAAFHNLVTAYLLACPPAHPSLAFTGDRLPAFIAGHPLAEERPWLVPLAHLERAYVEIFDGPDATTVSLDDLRGLPPAELMAVPLALIPCHRLLAHNFAIDPLWRAIDDGRLPEPVVVSAEREVILAWRHDVDVSHRVIDGEERPLLALAAAGTTVERLCEEVNAGSTGEAAQKVFQLLGRWLADGVLIRPP
jgi:hypothetical protein